jgi:hypothetical protein
MRAEFRNGISQLYGTGLALFAMPIHPNWYAFGLTN